MPSEWIDEGDAEFWKGSNELRQFDSFIRIWNWMQILYSNSYTFVDVNLMEPWVLPNVAFSDIGTAHWQ